MEPFNIRITHYGKEITLTINPENDYFKIIYYGGIVGAIKKVGEQWELLKEEDIEPGGLPLYDYKKGYGDDHKKLELQLPEINLIAEEIDRNFKGI